MECIFRDLTIYYEIHGHEDGIPLVMVHGFPADHNICVDTVEPVFLQRKGWKRIYFDLPGMGQSSTAEWIDSHDAMLDAILNFVDQVLPGQRFAVGGFSWGGYWSRGMVCRQSERMLGQILIAPGMQNEEKQHWPKHIVLWENPELIAELPPDLAKEFQSVAVVQNREVLDVLVRDIKEPATRVNQAFFERLNKGPRLSFDLNNTSVPFPVPTLIITGRHDSIAGYYDSFRMVHQYSRATYAVLDRAGHALAFEQRSLFNALANEWLDRVEEYAGKDVSEKA